jgi:mannose-1-phosphate guanylyltransferase
MLYMLTGTLHMKGIAESWALILAGGDGSRLREVTTTGDGQIIPKQYCSLTGSSSLLQDAIRRARSVALASRVAAVVAAQHRRWWSSAALGCNEAHIFVQPQNRGTANGILFALLRLERLSPNATVTLLPADHYYRDERALTRALRAAVNIARQRPEESYLLGADPDGPDPELGYVLPASRIGDVPAGIAGFKEKPSADYARELLSIGALWNLFILVGSIRAILALFEKDYASTVADMREALGREAGGDRKALGNYYQNLAPLDFSRDILEIQATRLQIIRVPRCGWTDLGTPKRVEDVVRRMVVDARIGQTAADRSSRYFDLSARYQAAL